MTQHTKGPLFMGNYSLPVPPAHAQRVYQKEKEISVLVSERESDFCISFSYN